MPSAVLRTDSEPGAVYAALEPEIRRALPRTETTISREGDTVTITVEAADTSSLRASVNSLLECLTVTQRINSVTKDFT